MKDISQILSKLCPLRKHPFKAALVYGVDNPDQPHGYVFLSTGRDGIFNETINCGTTTNFNDDIIYADGGFIQWPEGSQH